MDRRSTLLGLTGGVVSGPALTQNLQGWLEPFDKNTVEGQKNLSQAMGKLGDDHIDMLQLSARKLYDSCKYYGGSDMNRKLAISILHEVSVASEQKNTLMVQQELYKIMANLAHTIAEMSWHMGFEQSAQNYYQLALRAAHAGHERLYSTMILVDYTWQMYYLGKYQDGLNLIQLAQRGTRNIAGPQVKAMLAMHAAWGYAAMGQETNFQHAIALSEKYLARAKIGDEPYWVAFSDQSQLAGMAGSGLSLLAIHKPNQYAEQASEHNAKAIQLRDKSTYRYAALDYLWLAKSRFLLSDTELAINATEKALTIFAQLQNRCGATHRRLHEIYKYTNQANQSKQLQALNQKLKSVLASV